MNISQSNEVNERLRFCRALNIFSRALTFYVIGKKEVDGNNLFSASVNLYYSIFHISVASLLLHPSYSFKKEKFYLLPNEEIPFKKARLEVRHSEVEKKLKEIREDHRFLNKLYDIFDDAKELRELASYGPYVKLYAAEDIPSEGVLSKRWIFINTYPIALKELKDISKTKPRPFKPVRERIENEVKKTYDLIKSFSEYFKEMLNKYLNNYIQKDRDLIAKIFFLSWCYEIPIYIRHYVSKDVYDEVIKLAKDFCNEVSEEYLDTFEKAYSSKGYKEILKVCEEGGIIEHKMAFEEKQRI